MNQKDGILVKTTLVDFPPYLSAAFFFKGCNLRCPYCYNVPLVVNSDFSAFPSAAINNQDFCTIQDLYNHLKKRAGILQGLVLSGGEALLYPKLKNIIKEAKNLGYKVKLDTNGTLPQKLSELFLEQATTPDYIAMDIKTSPERYVELTSLAQPATEDAQNTINLGDSKLLEEKILTSIKLLSALPKESYEFRTVLVPNLVAKKDIIKIAELIPKNATWYLSHFENKNCLNPKYNTLTPYTEEEIQSLLQTAKKIIPQTLLR